MALTQLVDNISLARDNKEITLGVFVDLSKAFDTVNHNILLQKLSLYGINGTTLSWFQSYLSSRKQLVCWNNTSSEQKLISCGVPQGSILGPLLFLIYINDLYLTSPKAFFILFADDSNIFLSGKDEQSLIIEMNHELSKIDSWFKANKLSLNVKKSSYMLFMPYNHSVNSSLPNIHINNNTLERVTVTKFLGILIDDKLNWKNHTALVSNKVSKNIGVIRRIRHLVTRKILVNLYYTMIYPYISYCNIVWASTFKTNLNCIHLLQKRYVKMITFSNKFTSSTPLFQSLRILPISDLNNLHICIFLFQSIHKLLPACHQNVFKFNHEIHSHNTRSAGDLHPAFFRSTTAQFSIKFRGPHFWNSLPTSIRTCTNLRSFKKQSLQHLLSNL